MPPLAVGVAYSGGVDSTALLWVTARAARELGLAVWALHVHHGLMAEADQWVLQAKVAVDELSRAGLPVQLAVAYLPGQPMPGESVEAWARRGRYHALAELAASCGLDLVLLGQHAEDQAETVLLQALRGAGPAGLAAMPQRKVSQGVTWARPWLGQPRRRIQAAVAASGLVPVLDPSNADTRYARSRLRQQVWPALVEHFPQAATVLGEVARHAAQARALAEEIAAMDRLACVAPDGGLRYREWAELTPARRRNLLAAWLAPFLPGGTPVSLVDRVLCEWTGLGRRWPTPRGWLLSKRHVLYFQPSSREK
ncbi:tRNA lysidine(34) synthetase TilS [Inhella gelatinilytica]|uniref:tRNA(Ile)-lysidine synthase n=1 Tax=Inhella gelatinilytica TaxID=2795030 RepID=A0A931IYA9_9BURK|nr:tRNA lysidine(34) synthetase TilS [Inhella gelatinilytica]MBH9554127.1 tRNA lysidine(34) synthetase TilS [Inhella gelatinilytica]